jgi:pimeloyl-ACP methyl ester carboxylesterase
MASVRRTRRRARDLDVACLEAGDGPLVLLCHGFPELGFSWRHQLPALAEAGFHAVAPDLRGYGGTVGEASPDTCAFDNLIKDLEAIVHALGEARAFLVGHDFGAFLAWHAAACRPDLFSRVACLSVPYPTFLMGPEPPTAILRARAGEGSHYILYFQDPGPAEAELEADVGTSLARIYAEATAEAPGAFERMEAGAGFLDTAPKVSGPPAWLGEEDFAVYVDAFTRRGFAGPLAWYRAVDLSWERLSAWRTARVEQPALFLVGERDPILEPTTGLRRRMPEMIPRLRGQVVLPDCGHWLQQEQPEATNRALIEFLHAAG